MAMAQDVSIISESFIDLRALLWVISLSLKKQFVNFFALPGIARFLGYREQRHKHRENNLEDIFDGVLYRELQENGTIGPSDYTIVFNTDGFKLFKHRTLSVWVLLVRLNELPPNLRQRHLFLAGIWIDKLEPNMNTFLKPCVAEANQLSTVGILWRPFMP